MADDMDELLTRGARLRVMPVDDSGQVLLDEFARLLGPRTKLVAVTQVSNALGTVTPVREIAAMAKHAGACVLVDAEKGNATRGWRCRFRLRMRINA